jgi:hypothetical protein
MAEVVVVVPGGGGGSCPRATVVDVVDEVAVEVGPGAVGLVSAAGATVVVVLVVVLTVRVAALGLATVTVKLKVARVEGPRAISCIMTCLLVPHQLSPTST